MKIDTNGKAKQRYLKEFDMKKKLDEAFELLTQLRINLTDSDRPALERNAYDIEMKICEVHDLLNKGGLTDVTQWVAVEDGLPDDDRWVLASHILDEWVDRAEYNKDEGYWHNGECEIIVTHWKELPKPPCG